MVNRTVQDALRCLIGEQLSSVEFVQDYLQLKFDGPVLTVLTPARIEAEGSIYLWLRNGFRDALCAQIAHIVTNIDCNTERLRISFDNGSSISISLSPEDYTGPEAIVFTNDENFWVV